MKGSIFDSNDSSDNSSDENDDQLCFSMLCTDDDDDDVDYGVDISSNEENAKPNHRPAPPEWSLPMNRKLNVINQTDIADRVIDQFFGCEYEIVDMLEIFPKTHPKKAKRRKSSMKWDTPPRHSILPKY